MKFWSCRSTATPHEMLPARCLVLDVLQLVRTLCEDLQKRVGEKSGLMLEGEQKARKKKVKLRKGVEAESNQQTAETEEVTRVPDGG